MIDNNQKNYLEVDKPQMEIMEIISACYSMVGEMQRLLQTGTKGSKWATLISTYYDLLNRTDEIVPNTGEYRVNPKEYNQKSLDKMIAYLHQLKIRGLFGVGKDEVIFWKIGSQ